MDKLFGIENLKKAVSFGLKLGTDVGKSLEDGKLTWDEYPVLLGDLMGAGPVIATGKDLKNEINELDETEAGELRDYIKQNFDIEDDKLEAKIEAAINAVASLYDLYLVFSEKQ